MIYSFLIRVCLYVFFIRAILLNLKKRKRKRKGIGEEEL